MNSISKTTSLNYTSDTTTYSLLATKWANAGWDNRHALIANEAIAQFLIDAHVHTAQKQFGNALRFASCTSKAELHVEGEWVDAATFLKGKTIEDGLICSDNTPWIFTGARGYEHRHYTSWEKLEPVYYLNADQLEVAQTRAAKLPSPLSKNLPQKCILEIVTTWKGLPSTGYFSGIADMTNNPRHSWVRLIDEQGGVYSVGFGFKAPVPYCQGAQTVDGTFYSPELYETVPMLAQVVTGIAISSGQFDQLKSGIERAQRVGPAYNYGEQNCCNFVQSTLSHVGITGDFSIPIYLLTLRLTPLGIQNAVAPLGKIISPLKKGCVALTPEIMARATSRVSSGLHALAMNSLLLFTGGWRGKELMHFEHLTSEHESPPLRNVQLITSWSDLFSTKNTRVTIPRQVLEWQMLSPSTRIADTATGGMNEQYSYLECSLI